MIFKAQKKWLLLLASAIAFIACNHGFRPVEELVDIPRIAKEDLKARLQDPSVSIIDVRYAPNWKESDVMITGAAREDPMEIGLWTDRYPKNQTLVLYCD
jgi:hypothetical protein